MYRSWILVGIVLISILILVPLSRLSTNQKIKNAHLQITPTVAQTLVNPSNTPQPTLSSISYEELLSVHNQVLQTVQSTTNTIIVALTTILGGGGVITLGLITYMSRSVKLLNDKAKSLDAELKKLDVLKIELSNDITSQMSKVSQLTQEAIELNAKYIQDDQILDGQKRRLDDLDNMIRQTIRGYEESIRQSALIYSIEKETGLAISPNYEEKLLHTNSLIELSSDTEAINRRRCIRVFENMLAYPAVYIESLMIEKRLCEMLKDEELSVKLEAQRVVDKLKIDCNSK